MIEKLVPLCHLHLAGQARVGHELQQGYCQEVPQHYHCRQELFVFCVGFEAGYQAVSGEVDHGGEGPPQQPFVEVVERLEFHARFASSNNLNYDEEENGRASPAYRRRQQIPIVARKVTNSAVIQKSRHEG